MEKQTTPLSELPSTPFLSDAKTLLWFAESAAIEGDYTIANQWIASLTENYLVMDREDAALVCQAGALDARIREELAMG